MIGFRKDVQGLRAIAVLLVYFSHANLPYLEGGYIGVDIFFVISGYVITLSLIKEFVENKSLQIHEFYKRRMIRLFPALLVMIFVSMLLSLLILSPHEQLLNYPSLKKALLWISNFYFMSLDNGYFDSAIKDYIFIHTWSLGVEEQFYLVWPLIILMGLGQLSKAKVVENDVKLNSLKRLVLIFGIVSLILSLVLFSMGDNNRAFYLMPSRAWQFAVGTLIALYHMQPAKVSVSAEVGRVLSLKKLLANLALLIIALAAFVFDNETIYPGWKAIVPTFAAAMILLVNKDFSFKGILSSKCFVFLGGVSYSFYLWHWPVLFFQRKIDVEITLLDQLFAFLIVLALSVCSYYLIERNLKLWLNSFRFNYSVLTFVTLTILILSSSVFVESSSKKYSQEMEQRKIMAVKRISSPIYTNSCDTWYFSAELKFCEFLPADARFEKHAFLVGDSVATQWYTLIAGELIQRGWKVTVLTKSSCPWVDRSYYYPRIKSIYKVCEIWRNAVIEEVGKKKPDLVVMGSASTYPFSKSNWIDGTTSVLSKITDAAEKVILLGGGGGLGFDGALCLARSAWQENTLSRSLSECSVRWEEPVVQNWLKEAALKFDRVEYVDFNDLIFPDGLARSINQGVVVFRDSLHLTDEFINFLSPKIIIKVMNIVDDSHIDK